MSATIGYFGYGSLVNRSTLAHQARPVRASLRGFRRAWRATSMEGGRGVCALSVEPSEEHEIRGLFIEEPAIGLSRLDDRERNYDRHVMDVRLIALEAERPSAEGFFLYRARARHARWGDSSHPIHLSYVDCVLQGFYREWGEAGISHFMETTDGWHVPIVDDRASPTYPRAQILSMAERALVDRALADVGATIRHRSTVSG